MITIEDLQLLFCSPPKLDEHAVCWASMLYPVKASSVSASTFVWKLHAFDVIAEESNQV